MWKRLLKRLKALFSGPKPTQSPADKRPKTAREELEAQLKDPNRTKPTLALGAKNGNVTIRTQSQLDKQTPFKPGEKYALGDCVVTVHASKEDMLKAIKEVDERREKRHAELRERAIEIMLMSPEELLKFRVDEWLKERAAKGHIVELIVGPEVYGVERYIAPKQEQPSGSPKERFKDIMKDAVTDKEKDKV